MNERKKIEFMYLLTIDFDWLKNSNKSSLHKIVFIFVASVQYKSDIYSIDHFNVY